MRDPLNGRRYPQVRCTDSGDWYDSKSGKLVATSAQMAAYYRHERAAGRVPHFVPRTARPAPAAAKTASASKPASKPTNKLTASPARSNTPPRRGNKIMTQSQRAKAERDALIAKYTASELQAANAVMALWKSQAEQGNLPAGFDYSIDHAVRVARQSGTVKPSASKPVFKGSRLYVSDPGDR